MMMLTVQQEISMTFCEHCGKELRTSNDYLCPSCRLRADGSRHRNPGGVREQTYGEAPFGLSKLEFRKSYSKGAKQCAAAAGFGYVSTAITIVFSFFPQLGGSLFMLLDAFVVLVFSLLIHFSQSRVASVLFLLGSVYNCIVIYTTNGFFGGYLLIIGGILAVIGSFKYATEWRAYQAYAY
jgi:hypothetical protein